MPESEGQGALRIDDTSKAAPKWRIVGVAKASISFVVLCLLGLRQQRDDHELKSDQSRG